jgi:hypothetical protein
MIFIEINSKNIQGKNIKNDEIVNLTFKGFMVYFIVHKSCFFFCRDRELKCNFTLVIFLVVFYSK